MKIEWEACARIVAQEVRRLRWNLIGSWFSLGDYEQELSIVAFKSAERHDGRSGDAYVRTSVRNALKKLYRDACAAKRHPQDRYGRPMPFVADENVLARCASGEPTPEKMAAMREQIQIIAACLDDSDRQRLLECAAGKREADSKFVRKIRNRIDLSTM